MAMEIDIARAGETVTAAITGRVDGSNAREFQDTLIGAIEETDRDVVLDFANLTYISSAGLRAVLLAAKSLARQEAKLQVRALSTSVREVFETSGFDKIISIRD